MYSPFHKKEIPPIQFMRFLFLSIWLSAFGSQLPSLAIDNRDSTLVPNKKGRLFIGWDLSRTAMWIGGGRQKGIFTTSEYLKGKQLFGFGFGLARQSADLDRFSTESRGTFLRAGVTRCFLADGDNLVGFGLHAATSFYQTTPSKVLVSIFPENGFVSTNAPSPDSQVAVWLEWTGMARTQLYRQIQMGFEVSLRWRAFVSDSEFPAYFIPGYGLRQNGFQPSVRYFIFVRIPKM